MGTVIGGTIVSALMRADAHLRNLLFWDLTDLHDSAKLCVLAGYGLVYCYISSIPILVLHAARSLLPIEAKAHREPNRIGKWLRDNSIIFLILFLWVILVATLKLPIKLLDSNDIDLSIGNIGLWAYLTSFAIPLLLIVAAIIHRKRCYAFYRALANVRASQADVGEFITSYRHLREHGNSIFIVTLECVLGITLYGAFRISQQLAHVHTNLSVAPQFYLYSVVALLWIVPGALVWLFAALIEYEFIKGENQNRAAGSSRHRPKDGK